jgi:hypothetical protein
MVWCRFEKDGRASHGVVDGETVADAGIEKQ